MLSGSGGFVSTSVVCSLHAAGYSFYFGSDTRLVEACCGEFVGTCCASKLVRFVLFY